MEAYLEQSENGVDRPTGGSPKRHRAQVVDHTPAGEDTGMTGTCEHKPISMRSSQQETQKRKGSDKRDY
jgi:hypothetical protein